MNVLLGMGASRANRNGPAGYLATLLAAFFLALFAFSAQAGTVKIPPKKPAILVDIPDSWAPEETDKGVGCESPDAVATVFFEVAKSEKGMNKILDDNFEWLKDQGVKIDGSTKQEKQVMVGGVASDALIFDASNKEYGPARVGFIFTPIGERLVITTYWITKKGAAKHEATLTQIFNSVRPLK